MKYCDSNNFIVIRVTSYFGDPVMTEEQIVSVVKDVQELAGGAIDGLNDNVHYVEYIKFISDHPIVNTFITGGGSVSFGMSNIYLTLYAVD